MTCCNALGSGRAELAAAAVRGRCAGGDGGGASAGFGFGDDQGDEAQPLQHQRGNGHNRRCRQPA